MDLSNDRSTRSKELWAFALAFLFFAFDFRRDEIDTQTGVGILLQYLVFAGAALASAFYILVSPTARRAISTPGGSRNRTDATCDRAAVRRDRR